MDIVRDEAYAFPISAGHNFEEWFKASIFSTLNLPNALRLAIPLSVSIKCVLNRVGLVHGVVSVKYLTQKADDSLQGAFSLEV